VVIIIPNYYLDQRAVSQQEGNMLMQISGDSEESITSYIDALIKAPLLVSQSAIVGMVFSQITLSNIIRTHVLLVMSDRSSDIVQLDLRIAKRLVLVLILSVAALIVSASGLFILQISSLSTELGLSFTDTFSILINTSTGTTWLIRIITSIIIAVFSTTYFICIRRGLASKKRYSKGVSKYNYVFLSVILISGAINLMSNSVVSHNAATEFFPLLAVSVDWFHIMGVSIWLGGLFYLSSVLLYVIEISGKDVKYGSDRPMKLWEQQIAIRNSYSLAIMLPYFSMIAILCLGVIGTTGLYMAWLQLQSVGSLFTSTYGNILILKLSVIFPMIALGAYHQIKLHCVMVHAADKRRHPNVEPNIGDRYDPFRRFCKTIKIESLIGIAVLVISSFLTITSPPTMVQSIPDIQISGSELSENNFDSSTEGDEKPAVPKLSDGFSITALILGIIVIVISLYYYRKNRKELKATISLLKKH
jgi:putative copper export protein